MIQAFANRSTRTIGIIVILIVGWLCFDISAQVCYILSNLVFANVYYIYASKIFK